MSDGAAGQFDQQNNEVRDFTPTSAVNQAVHLEPGLILFDKFKVIKLLGRGGMGSVYQVQHLHLRTEYALKCLNRQQQNDASWRRFENEARAANKLDHPNLIKVYDSGLLPDGQPYFVMDLVSGITLAEEMKKHGRLPVDVVLKLFVQVGFALAYAHEAGVIHRDVKPTNIMIITREDGTLSNTVKVVDFGIAKLTGQDEFNQQTLTRTGEIFGSPLYMSPEQCIGITVDHRSDLYSVGCVMYEALTGAPPFFGDSALTTMMRHQTDKPLSLKEASLGIEFPEQLEQLVQKLLEKDPDDRYMNASLLTADLVALEQSLHTGETMHLNLAGTRIKPEVINAFGYFSTVRNTTISVLSLAIAFCLGLGAGQMITKQTVQIAEVAEPIGPAMPRDEEIEVGSKLRLSKRGQLEKIPDKPKVAAPIVYKPGYFSQELGKVRTFYFPKEVSLGEMYSSYVTDPLEFEMKGDVAASVPLTIKVNDTFLENPKLLDKFRPDEVYGIKFLSCEKPAGRFLSHASRFTSLISVDLCNSAANKDDIKYLEKIGSLQKVNFAACNITAKDVSGFKRLMDMTAVGLNGLQGSKSLLKKLASSKELVRLEVAGCGVDVDDLKTISSIQRLTYVDLTKEKALNDQTLPLLINAKYLSSLDLEKCDITRASIPTIRKFRNLVSLRMTDPEGSTGPNSFQSDFKKSIPGVEFNFQESIRVLPFREPGT